MWDDNKDVRFLGNSGGWGVGAWMGWNAERKVHKNYIGIVKEAGKKNFDWLIEKILAVIWTWKQGRNERIHVGKDKRTNGMWADTIIKKWTYMYTKKIVDLDWKFQSLSRQG